MVLALAIPSSACSLAIRLLSGGCVEKRFAKNPSLSSRSPSRGFTMNRCAVPAVPCFNGDSIFALSRHRHRKQLREERSDRGEYDDRKCDQHRRLVVAIVVGTSAPTESA